MNQIFNEKIQDRLLEGTALLDFIVDQGDTLADGTSVVVQGVVWTPSQGTIALQVWSVEDGTHFVSLFEMETPHSYFK